MLLLLLHKQPRKVPRIRRRNLRLEDIRLKDLARRPLPASTFGCCCLLQTSPKQSCIECGWSFGSSSQRSLLLGLPVGTTTPILVLKDVSHKRLTTSEIFTICSLATASLRELYHAFNSAQ